MFSKEELMSMQALSTQLLDVAAKIKVAPGFTKEMQDLVDQRVELDRQLTFLLAPHGEVLAEVQHALARQQG